MRDDIEGLTRIKKDYILFIYQACDLPVERYQIAKIGLSLDELMWIMPDNRFVL